MPTPTKSHGCTWHWLSQVDLPEIAGLISAEEHLGDATHHHDLPALTAAVSRESLRATQAGSVLRKPSGALIAYAWVRFPEEGEPIGQLRLHSGCHPAWRHDGVQDTLLAWQIDRAREWQQETLALSEPLQLSMLASASNQFLTENLAARGFRPQRWYHALRRSLADALPPVAPSGVTLVRFGPRWSETVRQLHNEAVRDPADQLDPDAWDWSLENAGVRDDWSWVAVESSQAVGWALNAETRLAGETVGWTEYLGAAPAWRNRGLFQALLARSDESFAAAGQHSAGVGVDTDSDQGARPYLDLGYTRVDSMVWYVHHLAAG